jgi:hypothetical protein
MSQDININFKSVISPKKKRRNRKLAVALGVLVSLGAVYFYYQYIAGLTHDRHAVKETQTVAVTSKQKSVAPLAPPVNQPKEAKTDKAEPAKPDQAGFVESLMSVLVPTAEAITVRPEMPVAKLVPKQLPAQQIVSRPAPLPLTPEQQRLQVAQNGFDEVMNMAFQYPDRYGFNSDDNLRDATLGSSIPVYQVVQTNRAHYLGQPVKSLLQPANEWIYPVIFGNRICFMVSVRSDGRRYFLGNGSRSLAMVFDKILERWPAREGYHPQLVINPNMPSFYYFSIPEWPEQNITDTTRMLEFSPSLTPAAVILESWR